MRIVDFSSRFVSSIFILGSQLLLYTLTVLAIFFRIRSDRDKQKLITNKLSFIGLVHIVIVLISIKSGVFLAWITPISSDIKTVLSIVAMVLLIKQVSIYYIKNLTLE